MIAVTDVRESWECFMEILVDIPSPIQHITLLNIISEMGFYRGFPRDFWKVSESPLWIQCTCMCSIVCKRVPTWQPIRALKCVARCEKFQLILILLLFSTENKLIMKDFATHVMHQAKKIAGKFCEKQILRSLFCNSHLHLSASIKAILRDLIINAPSTYILLKQIFYRLHKSIEYQE